MKKHTIFTLALLFLLSSILLQGQDYRWQRMVDKATFDIAVNPLNYNTYYAGGEGRVVYRSWDAGVHWDTLVVNYKLGYTRFNNVLIHPIDTNIILVGGLNYGVIERCTSNCEDPNSWKVVLATKNPVSLNGKSMFFKPDQPDTVYAGDLMYGIIWRSTDKGATWDSISTVTRKYTLKREDGTTYDTVMSVRIGAAGIRHDSTNVIVVGSMDSDILISQDGGYTWNYMTTLTHPDSAQDDCEITRVVFSDRDPRVGYACITYLFFLNKNNGGLYKTTDGGYNWFQVAFPDTSLWALDVIGRGDNDEVFVGGYTEDFYVEDSVRVPGAGIVRRSQDGGKTWYSFDHEMNWAIRFPKSNSNLRSIYFPVKDTGFAVGKYGVILRSENAGYDWSTLYNPGYQYFRGAAFSNSKRGLIVASTGEIMRTVNGGVFLEEVFKDSSKQFFGIAILNKDTYVTVGADGLIMKTTDEGISDWKVKNSGVNDNLNSVFFVNEQKGWAVGTKGTIIVTNDGGETWSQQSSGTGYELNSIAFKDENTGLAVGFMGIILKTTDGGDTWTEIPAFTDKTLFSVSFNRFGDDKNIALITGEKATVYKTTDAGDTWTRLETKNVRDFYSSQVLTDLIYVSSGQYGTIIQSQSGGEYWFVNQRGEGPVSNAWSLRYFGEPGDEDIFLATEAGLFVLREPSDVYELSQYVTKDNALTVSYSNNTLKINYKLKNRNINGKLIFRISDITGRIIYQNEFVPGGAVFEKYLNNINLTSGAYICQMIEFDKSSARLIIVEQ